MMSITSSTRDAGAGHPFQRTSRRLAAVAVACWCLTATTGRAASAEEPLGEPAGSPLAVINARNAAILNAETVEELIDLGAVDTLYQRFLPDLSSDDRDALIDETKRPLERLVATVERLDGDRAVVLCETDRPDSWQVIEEMIRIGGSWQSVQQHFHETTPGARASFRVEGTLEDEVATALVRPFSNMPEAIVLNDALDSVLHGGRTVAEVTLVVPQCVATGSSYPMEDSLMRYTPGDDGTLEELPTFDQNVSGTLEVTEVQGDRFSGRFEMTAASREQPDQRVAVEGTLENIATACPGE